MSEYLKVEFLDSFQAFREQENRSTPFISPNTEVYRARVEKLEKLTQNEEKTTYKLSLDGRNAKRDFAAGDTIGILPSNDQMLIDKLLLRLNLEAEADKLCQVHILKAKNKKHLPEVSTIRRIFLNCVDVHQPPKKLFIKSLIKHTEDLKEKEEMQELSARLSPSYNEFIATSGKTLLGLLDSFPSCFPPVALLLEHLAPLQPRPYSISAHPNLEITFFTFIQETCKGVCTRWMENLKENDPVAFYFRQPTSFRLNPSVDPFILIATGTGIAPFRCFLQQLGNGSVWLLYGCRSSDDFLYKEELQQFREKGVLTKLDVCFSRQGKREYVQDRMKGNCEFIDWVLHKSAKIYVCGSGRTVQSVRTCLVSIFDEDFVKNMENTRFFTDSWLL